MNWKKAFTLTSFNLSSVCHARLCAVSFYQEFDGSRTFLLYEKECALAHSRAERGRLRHISSSRECASRGAFLCHREKFPMAQKKNGQFPSRSHSTVLCLNFRTCSAPSQSRILILRILPDYSSAISMHPRTSHGYRVLPSNQALSLL